MTVHSDEYDCIECQHSQDEPVSQPWDRQTWEDGYNKGYSEGYAAGRHDGTRALTSDLLRHFHRWGIDALQLQLYGPLTPDSVWQALLALVEKEAAPCQQE